VDAGKESNMAKGRVGLDHRAREKGGEIDKKHGNTLIGTLRKTYGRSFAKAYRSDKMLSSLLKDEGCKSLSEYLKKKI
jgi:hypothetical protein